MSLFVGCSLTLCGASPCEKEEEGEREREIERERARAGMEKGRKRGKERRSTSDLHTLALTHTQGYRCVRRHVSMYLHMYTYMYMYVPMYAHMHACMHACMHTCMHLLRYACVPLCMYACMHVYIHTRSSGKTIVAAAFCSCQRIFKDHIGCWFQDSGCRKAQVALRTWPNAHF